MQNDKPRGKSKEKQKCKFWLNKHNRNFNKELELPATQITYKSHNRVCTTLFCTKEPQVPIDPDSVDIGSKLTSSQTYRFYGISDVLEF